MKQFLTGCAAAASIAYAVNMFNETRSYTLYRSGVNLPNLRIHVASFDSSDGTDYNKGNCEIASERFQSQPGVEVKYWCEKGRFKP